MTPDQRTEQDLWQTLPGQGTGNAHCDLIRSPRFRSHQDSEAKLFLKIPMMRDTELWYHLAMTIFMPCEFAVGDLTSFAKEENIHLLVCFNRKCGPKNSFTKKMYYNPICMAVTFCETYKY